MSTAEGRMSLLCQGALGTERLNLTECKRQGDKGGAASGVVKKGKAIIAVLCGIAGAALPLRPHRRSSRPLPSARPVIESWHWAARGGARYGPRYFWPRDLSRRRSASPETCRFNRVNVPHHFANAHRTFRAPPQISVAFVFSVQLSNECVVLEHTIWVFWTVWIEVTILNPDVPFRLRIDERDVDHVKRLGE